MLIKTLECQVARFFARGLLPSFANFADNFLVRAVHDRFASTTGAGLQAADAFLYETFHLKIDGYMRHLCLQTYLIA